jgi:hypothetical protein
MPKKKNSRKPKPASSGPPKSVKDYARAYRCSHCRSRVDSVVCAAPGVYQMIIGHDESCPVLRGILTDAHDAVRAAVATGRSACVVSDPLDGGGK